MHIKPSHPPSLENASKWFPPAKNRSFSKIRSNLWLKWKILLDIYVIAAILAHGTSTAGNKLLERAIKKYITQLYSPKLIININKFSIVLIGVNIHKTRNFPGNRAWAVHIAHSHFPHQSQIQDIKWCNAIFLDHTEHNNNNRLYSNLKTKREIKNNYCKEKFRKS